MVKRLVYIFILMLSTASLSLASVHAQPPHTLIKLIIADNDAALQFPRDTSRIIRSVPQSTNRMDVFDRTKKIKEVAKPKHQSKPEKVVVVTTPTVTQPDTITNKKARRQRRPEGLERPPEIPRRGN